MTDEDRDDLVDEFDDRHLLTPARVLQIRFVGLVNALFNYIQWLIEQDRLRRMQK